MTRPHTFVYLFAAVLAGVGLVGCGSSNNSTANKPKEHSHEHDHHHHDDHGPNGGHVLELGEEEYHAEWIYDEESGNVKIIILDGEMKKEVPIAATEVLIETKVAGKDNAYKLAASNPTAGEKPTATRFEIEDKALVTALKAAGKGVTANFKADINGKLYSAKIEHHDHKH